MRPDPRTLHGTRGSAVCKMRAAADVAPAFFSVLNSGPFCAPSCRRSGRLCTGTCWHGRSCHHRPAYYCEVNASGGCRVRSSRRRASA
eukprot:4885312-Pyramimonas_sp.AAC.1